MHYLRVQENMLLINCVLSDLAWSKLAVKFANLADEAKDCEEHETQADIIVQPLSKQLTYSTTFTSLREYALVFRINFAHIQYHCIAIAN